MTHPLLEVEDLAVTIETPVGPALVLDRASLSLGEGETLGVVGESGCGKSTLIRAILGILPRAAHCPRGEIRFLGRPLLGLRGTEEGRRIRARQIGFIPQDPYLSLNPAFTVGRQLLETLREIDGIDPRRELVSMLRAVRLPDPEGALERYPHQFSGGQRQRLLIAAALARRPQLLIADEPTTALDVTTQGEILEVMRDLIASRGVSMLFVSHDFGVINTICDRVSVMYAGQSVETATTNSLIDDARHPYTRMLLACHPDKAEDFRGIPGHVPSPLAPPPGCRFAPRCPLAVESCRAGLPERTVSAPAHAVACPRHALTFEGAAHG